MIKISLFLLRRRKTFLFTTIIFLFISMSLFTYSYFTAKQFVENRMSLALKTYGDYVVAFDNSTEEEIKILNSDYRLKVGVIYEGDKINIGANQYHSGYIDATACEMLNIHLVSGDWPKSDREIVIEHFIAAEEGVSVGDRIDINDTDDEYLVAGIINNYSEKLNINLNYSGNTYPKVLLNKNTKTKNIGIVGFKNTSDYKLVQDSNRIKMQSILDKLIDDAESRICIENTNLYTNGLVYCAEIKLLSLIFMAIVLLLTLMCSYFYIKSFYVNYEKQIAICIVQGLEKRKGKYILLFQLLIIIIIATLLEFAMCSFLAIVQKESFLFLLEILRILSVWVVFILLLATVFVVMLNNNIIACDIPSLMKNNITYTLLRKKRRFTKTDILSYISKPRYKNTILLAFFMIWTMLSVVIYEQTEIREDSGADYYCYSEEINSSEIYNNYVVNCNSEAYFNVSDFEFCINNDKDVSCILISDAGDTTILHPKDEENSYLNRWNDIYSNYEDMLVMDSLLVEQMPLESQKYQSIINTQIMIVSEDIKNKIEKEFDIIFGKGVSIFLPQIKDTDISDFEGKNIILGGVQRNDDGLRFTSKEFHIDNILNRQYFDICSSSKENVDSIVVVIPVNEVINDTDIGINRTELYLRNNEIDIQGIEDNLSKIITKKQGGFLISKKADELLVNQYNRFVNRSLIMLLIIIAVTAVILCKSIVNDEMQINNNIYRQLRIQGMSIRQLSKLLAKSNFDGFIIAYIICCIVTFLIYKDFGLQIRQLGVALVSGLVIQFIVVLNINRKVNKISMLNDNK